MRRAIARIVLLFFALTLPLGGAGAAEEKPIRIEVPSPSNLQFLALWVAMGAGYFEQEGLKPEILVADLPRATGEKLLRGEADVALLPPPMFLGMMAEKKPIRLFASLLANEPINLVVRKEVAEARKLSLGAPLSRRLHGMKGLKIGLAGEVRPRLRALFASAGMDADKDLRLVVIAGPDQVDALAKGQVDGLFAHTPYLETALVTYRAVLVGDTSAGIVPALSDGQVHALATTPDVIARKPETIRAANRAVGRALRLLHTDPKASTDALIAYGAAGKDRRMLEAIVAIYGPAVPASPSLSLEGIKRDALLYPAHPRAPDFARTNPADFVAPFAVGPARRDPPSQRQ